MSCEVKNRIVFGNHKGGVGKSVLLFHTACEIAKSNPDNYVLVIDFTELGDVSKLFLGGVGNESKTDEGIGQQRLAANWKSGKTTTHLLQRAKESNLVDDLPEPQGQDSDKPRDMIDMFTLLSLGEHTGEMIDIQQFFVRPGVIRGDKHIPKNLHLIPSAGERQKHGQFPAKELMNIKSSLFDALENGLDNKWIVLMDTDGDRSFSEYSLIAFAIARHVVIPLEADPFDFKRVRTLISEINSMQENRQSNSKVKQIVWNKVTPYRDEASEVSSLYKPSTFDMDMILALNKCLHTIATDTKGTGLFSADVCGENFTRDISTCVRTFGMSGGLAGYFGIPFCTDVVVAEWPKLELEGVKLPSANAKQISKMKANIELFAQRILSQDTESLAYQ